MNFIFPNEFHVTWSTTGHTGADVPVMAGGPGSELLSGRHENIWLHEVIASVLP